MNGLASTERATVVTEMKTDRKNIDFRVFKFTVYGNLLYEELILLIHSA